MSGEGKNNELLKGYYFVSETKYARLSLARLLFLVSAQKKSVEMNSTD